MDLLTDAQLAEMFEVEVDHLHRLRKRHNWPCVKLGRFDYRFTQGQVEQIIAKHTISSRKSTGAKPLGIEGQTARSASRKKAS